jgi:spore maturation protein SpmB
VQVAKREIPNSNERNVFIEGAPDRYEIARVMIQQIVHEHIKITESLRILGAAEVNPFPGPHTLMPVQALMSDVVIGTSG